jgi:putative ABC transport system permease protein
MNLNNDLKIIYRNLLRNKTYALINILGLAIGLAVFIFIFIYIRYEVSYDRFHTNFNEISRVEIKMQSGGQVTFTAGCPPPLADSLKKEFPEIINSVKIVKEGTTLLSYNRNKKINIENSFWTENSFLSVFSFKLIEGNPNKVLTNPYSVVLTKSISERIFGNENPIGKKIRFNNLFDLSVEGIIEDAPVNSHLGYKVLISLSTLSAQYGKQILDRWSENWVCVYLQVNPQTNVNAFEQKIEHYLKKFQGNSTTNLLYLKSLKDIHLNSNVSHEISTNGDYKNIIALYFVAIFVLLIACINFMNLSTAYSANRAKEVGIKKVVGSRRTSLILQFLSESVLMAFLSLLIALTLIEFLMPVLNSIIIRQISFKEFETLDLFIFLILLTFLVGLMAGSYPAIVLSAHSPVKVLKGCVMAISRHTFLRKLLVVLQFFISVSLIIVTIVILLQVNYVNNKDLGYDSKGVFYISMRNPSSDKISAFKRELLKHELISLVSAHDNLPNASSNWTGITWPGAGDEKFIKINVNYVDTDFLMAYNIGLVEGSNFNFDQVRDTLKYILINETAAQEIGWKKSVGKKVILYGDYRINKPEIASIAGVVKDFHFQSLHQKISPLMMVLLNNGMSGVTMSIKLKKGNAKEVLRFIQQKFEILFPDEAFDCRYLQSDFKEMYQEELKMSKLVSYFALLAIFIASLGVFGLISFTISQRIKEIGIRKVLGASVSSIFIHLTRDFVILLIIANLLAFPVAYLLSRKWLDTFPYHIDLTLWPFIFASALGLLITLCTISYKVLRAAWANPVESLRYE